LVISRTARTRACRHTPTLRPLPLPESTNETRVSVPSSIQKNCRSVRQPPRRYWFWWTEEGLQPRRGLTDLVLTEEERQQQEWLYHTNIHREVQTTKKSEYTIHINTSRINSSRIKTHHHKTSIISSTKIQTRPKTSHLTLNLTPLPLIPIPLPSRSPPLNSRNPPISPFPTPHTPTPKIPLTSPFPGHHH
jgi:hypothetical protein